MLSFQSRRADKPLSQARKTILRFRRWTWAHNRRGGHDSPIEQVTFVLWLLLGLAAIACLTVNYLVVLVFCLLWVALVVGGAWISSERVPPRLMHDYQTARETLLMSTNVRAVGPLLELYRLEAPSEDAQTEVHQALIRLLPQLQSDDALLLDARQRAQLYRLLGKPYTAAMTLEIASLKALAQIGDSKALSLVEKMLQDPQLPPPLLVAARQCRALLCEKQTLGYRTGTLLRAVQVPVIPDEQLLRPPVSAEAQPEQLLRSAPDNKVP